MPVAAGRFSHEETIMRYAAKGIMFSMLILSMSAYAQAGGGGAGGGAAGGQGGGAGMGTPKAGGETGSVSGASGANTMDKPGGTSQKQMKKGEMNSPASDAGSGSLKKAY
jgi:hypothetical protein